MSLSTPHPKWPMNKIRTTFFTYFTQKHSHTYVPSSPSVPHDDPTLLFTNAGMNQFKTIFLGTVDPSLDLSKLTRAVNSQKCIRAGGKHNDLDDVGFDVYHHTFFEMLGNWSFGDYFKKEAIGMAWECLTVEFGLNPERLYATYFGGDDTTPADEEAKSIWLEFLPKERVLPFDAKDNFWEMGATGPCGPCTEIHYDRIGDRDAADRVNADVPDVIEIWNVVFIQFNREADGSLRSLPSKHIDTGMGFERLASILQGVDSNYDTDIFGPIFDVIKEVTGAEGYGGRVGEEDVGNRDMAYRVIADHVRTLCFSISDGAMPSNDGRGYVLRRVLRRAVRYGRQCLGAELGFFERLVPTVVRIMGETYPELKKNEGMVREVIREEETSFSRTLDKGLLKFKELAEKCDDKVFKGEDAHFLYTSMGFPVDLTELMATEMGMTLDKAGFQNKMAEEVELSNQARKMKLMAGAQKDLALEAEQTSYLLHSGVKPTEDEHKYVWNKELEGCRIKALFLGRGETDDGVGFVDSVSSEHGAVGIILDKTSFYAEAGGQVSDTGTLSSSDTTFEIQNVQSYGGFILHTGTITSGTLTLNSTVTCSVDYQRRHPIAANHTMTHILNLALRDTLQSEKFPVDQKGSLVDEFKLRFDFSYNKPVTTSQLADVERSCRDRIDASLPVQNYTAPLEQAQKIAALRAVFGEVYPDPVRVVSIAPFPPTQILSNPQDATWNQYSIEFCGGTHLENTKEAERFVLLNEEGIAKGIRRITAVTGEKAQEAMELCDKFETKVSAASQNEGLELERDIKKLSEELKTLPISAVKKEELKTILAGYGKQVMQWKKQQSAQMTEQIISHLLELGSTTAGGTIVTRYDFGADGKIAKSVMTSYSKKGTKPMLMVSASEDKYMVLACVPKGVNKDCKAWVEKSLEGTGGKGGGKKDSAMFTVVGGLEKIDGVLEKAKLI